MAQKLPPEIENAIASAQWEPCVKHCTICEGEDHHWMPDEDEVTGEMVMACKHCEAVRPITDADLDAMDI